jgi:hypothetical protein
MPGAFFAKDFSVTLHFRAVGFSGLRIKGDLFVL